MKRKLVKQGAATLMISLPAKWAKTHNLDKGDEINIEEKGNTVLISIEEQKVKKETTITISSENESSVRTIITSAYRLGYDKITVKTSLKVIEKIKEVVKNLLGFEIIKQYPDGCTIENITEPSAEQFDNIFAKVILNIEELFLIAKEMIEGKKSKFEEIEHKITEFDNFCRRVIAKNQTEKNRSLREAFHSSLYRGQREIYHLLIYLEKKPKDTKAQKEFLELLEQIKEVFILLKEAYYKKDLSQIEKLHEKEKEIIYNKGYKALKRDIDDIVVYHILAAVRNFYLASSPLTGTIITLES
jgi:phosphate uptake regulator